MKTIISILLLISSTAYSQDYFIDQRDSIQYEVIKIGRNLWLKENLKFKTPTSWCSEFPNSEACKYGNYYYPTDLIKVCPDKWRVPTWKEYKEAIKEIEEYYNLSDSIMYITDKLPLYKNLMLEGERVINLTLIGDSTFFDLSATGWIEGNKWEPDKQTSLWIIHDISNTPQPHIHITSNEVIMHSHGHNVLDKPKKLRRFAVRCISDLN